MKINKKLVSVMVVLAAVLPLAACGGKPAADPNQKMTEIAGTVQAQLTLTAAVNPTATQTFTPTATNTPSPSTPTKISSPEVINPTIPPSNTKDDAKFIADVTIPDGTVVKPGEQFIKTWRLQNTGKTTWTKEFSVLYLEGNLKGRNDELIFKLPAEVRPGEYADVSVPFTAPKTKGNYSSYWKMYNASGYVFGDVFNIYIVVADATPTNVTPTLTPTETPGATFSPAP